MRQKARSGNGPCFFSGEPLGLQSRCCLHHCLAVPLNSSCRRAFDTPCPLSQYPRIAGGGNEGARTRKHQQAVHAATSVLRMQGQALPPPMRACASKGRTSKACPYIRYRGVRRYGGRLRAVPATCHFERPKGLAARRSEKSVPPSPFPMLSNDKGLFFPPFRREGSCPRSGTSLPVAPWGDKDVCGWRGLRLRRSGRLVPARGGA